MEHRALFSKVSYHAEGDKMQVIAVLREELTERERHEIETDIEKAIGIIGKLTELKHL